MTVARWSAWARATGYGTSDLRKKETVPVNFSNLPFCIFSKRANLVYIAFQGLLPNSRAEISYRALVWGQQRWSCSAEVWGRDQYPISVWGHKYQLGSRRSSPVRQQVQIALFRKSAQVFTVLISGINLSQENACHVTLKVGLLKIFPRI